MDGCCRAEVRWVACSPKQPPVGPLPTRRCHLQRRMPLFWLRPLLLAGPRLVLLIGLLANATGYLGLWAAVTG